MEVHIFFWASDKLLLDPLDAWLHKQTASASPATVSKGNSQYSQYTGLSLLKVFLIYNALLLHISIEVEGHHIELN